MDMTLEYTLTLEEVFAIATKTKPENWEGVTSIQFKDDNDLSLTELLGAVAGWEVVLKKDDIQKVFNVRFAATECTITRVNRNRGVTCRIFAQKGATSFDLTSEFGG